METNFINLLINPNTKAELVFHLENPNLMIDVKTGETFKYHNQVAYLFNPDYSTVEKSSTLHQKFESTFFYHEHYIKDADVYDYFAEPESKAIQHENRRLHETIFKKIIKTKGTILDVGCGGAWVAKMALQKGFRVISMDISSKNPEKALQKFPNTNHYGLVADVYQIPIKDGSLDIIVASEIMEHVPDPKKFVEILYSKLSPKGKLLITTPYNEKIKYHLCVHCNKPTPQSAHLHKFHENNIQSLIPNGAKWKWEKFSNKYLTLLKTHWILQFVPFILWKGVDKFSNSLFPKQQRLLIEITKI